MNANSYTTSWDLTPAPGAPAPTSPRIHETMPAHHRRASPATMGSRESPDHRPERTERRRQGGVRFQPVDAEEVAARLVELALGAPAGLVPDLVGPRVYEMRELVIGYLRASRKHRPIVPIRSPGKAASAVRGGAPGPGPGCGPPDLGGLPVARGWARRAPGPARHSGRRRMASMTAMSAHGRLTLLRDR